ncbi:hypothetical protein A7P95_05605 [Eikenella longinqua]|uniref:Putative tail fiber protein gp53-like C-terminal domain-containing protein n=1 Tax=Eikenella longinqua TaxID=1795827 RepID=A0A1A9RYI9_9NEIS|nr:hypothetical protein A7P95_05605 [Eikenella longinqua]
MSELGTILPAWWLNQIQAELLAVLTAGGIQPDKAKPNQVLEALRKIIDEQAGGAVKTTGNQDIAGIKSFTNTLHAKSGLLASDSAAHFAASRSLKLGADGTSAYLKNQSSGKILSLLNNGELHYDGKRLLNIDDLQTTEASKAENGYLKMDGDIILQWIRIKKNMNAFQGTYNFPVAFPNSCAAIMVNSYLERPEGGCGQIVRAIAQSKSTFDLYVDIWTLNGHGNPATAYVFAIGY